MRKILYPILIFGAMLWLPRGVRAQQQMADPARPPLESEKTGINLRASTGTQTSGGIVSESTGDAAMIPLAPVVSAGPAPSVKDPALVQGDALLSAGDWRGARRISLSYLETHAKSAEGWTLLAKTYAAAQKYGKAVRRFDKALKFDPHNAAAFYGKGQAFEAQGKLDEALNEYQAAMRADAALADPRTSWQRLKDRISAAP